MNYTITKKDNGINELIITTNSEWGTICFSWEDSNDEFVTPLNAKGIDVFVDLLIDNPNTAYNQFVNGE